MPHAALADAVSKAVGRALEQHRDELAELVERQVDAEVERIVGELALEAVARRNGGRIVDAPSANETHALDVDEQAEELLRRTTCGRMRPRPEFGRDASRTSGYRSRCRSCRSEREYRPRAGRARRETAAPAARDAPRDDERPRPVGRAAENGRAAPTAPDAGERTPNVDEWLLEAGLAVRNGRGLVATELGLELGGYLDDSLAALST